jgi:hypothetical protein
MDDPLTPRDSPIPEFSVLDAIPPIPALLNMIFSSSEFVVFRVNLSKDTVHFSNF